MRLPKDVTRHESILTRRIGNARITADFFAFVARGVAPDEPGHGLKRGCVWPAHAKAGGASSVMLFSGAPSAAAAAAPLDEDEGARCVQVVLAKAGSFTRWGGVLIGEAETSSDD